MPFDIRHIHPGVSVYGGDGDRIGDVAEVGSNYLLVHQGFLFRKKLYIPLRAVISAERAGITVNAMASDVGQLGWNRPPADDAAPMTITSGGTTTVSQSTTASEDASATFVVAGGERSLDGGQRV